MKEYTKETIVIWISVIIFLIISFILIKIVDSYNAKWAIKTTSASMFLAFGIVKPIYHYLILVMIGKTKKHIPMKYLIIWFAYYLIGITLFFMVLILIDIIYDYYFNILSLKILIQGFLYPYLVLYFCCSYRGNIFDKLHIDIGKKAKLKIHTDEHGNEYLPWENY